MQPDLEGQYRRNRPGHGASAGWRYILSEPAGRRALYNLMSYLGKASSAAAMPLLYSAFGNKKKRKMYSKKPPPLESFPMDLVQYNEPKKMTEAFVGAPVGEYEAAVEEAKMVWRHRRAVRSGGFTYYRSGAAPKHGISYRFSGGKSPGFSRSKKRNRRKRRS